MYTVKILPNDITIEVQEGTTLLDVQIKAGLHPDAPCGGQGTCGKCLVDIVQDNGYHRTVRACQFKVEEDLTIEVKEDNDLHILETGTKRTYEIKPRLSADEIEEKKALGAAFDIGTTSVVCYLLDLATGKELAHASMLNPQSQFGPDVISRCEYAIAGGLSELSKVIRDALNQLLEEACAQAGKEKEQIYVATVVGNTCMHHLYMGIDPTPLTVVPYEAVVKDYMTVTSAEVDMQINPEGKVQILPNIAGPILVTAMLDIGTMMMELAGLSFLGLGAKPPTAEWGSMMSETRGLLQTVPWAVFAPGIAIFVAVMVFNLLGDAVRD